MTRVPPARAFRLALTGVPGTGKTTIAHALAARGASVVHLNDLARDAGLLTEKDEARGSYVVDLDALQDALDRHLSAATAPGGEARRAVVVEGHFAHDLDVDGIVLLRVDPRVLIPRLEARGWPAGKVRENVEAEALDVLAQEVLDTGLPATEMDVSGMAVEEAARALEQIVEKGAEALMGGRVGAAHWSLESLPWF